MLITGNNETKTLSERRFDIVFSGKLINGAEVIEVKENLRKLFQLNATAVEKLFSGDSIVIKTNIDRATASQYQQAITQAGASIQLRLHQSSDSATPTNKQNPKSSNEPSTKTGTDSDKLTLLPPGSALLNANERKAIDSIEIDINPADLRTDTFRASGAGGQHVNKTDSAIRITHVPTGAVVACQADRSQHKNRATAMKLLKAKLYEMEIQKQNEGKQELEDGKSDIGWGSQIRSYVLDDSRIKDLRTGVENRNTQAVLDGDLDKFLEASLKSGL